LKLILVISKREFETLNQTINKHVEPFQQESMKHFFFIPSWWQNHYLNTSH